MRTLLDRLKCKKHLLGAEKDVLRRKREDEREEG